MVCNVIPVPGKFLLSDRIRTAIDPGRFIPKVQREVVQRLRVGIFRGTIPQPINDTNGYNSARSAFNAYIVTRARLHHVSSDLLLPEVVPVFREFFSVWMHEVAKEVLFQKPGGCNFSHSGHVHIGRLADGESGLWCHCPRERSRQWRKSTSALRSEGFRVSCSEVLIAFPFLHGDERVLRTKNQVPRSGC